MDTFGLYAGAFVAGLLWGGIVIALVAWRWYP